MRNDPMSGGRVASPGLAGAAPEDLQRQLDTLLGWFATGAGVGGDPGRRITAAGQARARPVPVEIPLRRPVAARRIEVERPEA